MKRFELKVLRECAAAAVVLAAVTASPSAGWSKTSRHACELNDVPRLLKNWTEKLVASSPTNLSSIVGTYALDKPGPPAVLMPTCKNGPYVGRDKIADYFKVFLADTPVVTDLGRATVSGDCDIASASGLYTFKLKGGTGTELKARYTYVFQHGLILQHHSSLEPDPPGARCP
jgi:hypothetical protein